MGSTSSHTDLLCLWCGITLADASRVETDHFALVTCQCGVAYSAELLESADPCEWERILARDGFRVSRYDNGAVVVHRVPKTTVSNGIL